MVDDALSMDVRTFIIFLKYSNVVLQKYTFNEVCHRSKTLLVFIYLFFFISLYLKLDNDKNMEHMPTL